jgi:hypothetical protein
MLSLFATLVFSATAAQAMSNDIGRCLPLDPTNPAYQVLCSRFDQNSSGCETQRHICYWKSHSPFLKIELDSAADSSLIAKRPLSQ